MADCRAEFIVEPFEEGTPGPHVKAAVEAVRAVGMEPQIGALGTAVVGSAHDVARALAALVETALDAGASRVSMSVSSGDAEPQIGFDEQILAVADTGSLEGALDRFVAHIESELGGELADLNRVDKQAAVRILDERGAFLLRGSVEDVASMMGVSRITIYNYLNAIRES